MEDKYILHGEKDDNANLCPNVTFGKYLWNRIIKHDPKTYAEINGLTNEGITYGELLHQGKALSITLSKLGCGPNDLVITCFGNELEFTPCFLACLWNGSPCAPINDCFDINDYVHHLSSYGAKVIISSKKVYPRLREACRKIYQDKKDSVQFIVIGSKEEHEDFANCLFLSEIWNEPTLDNDKFIPFQLPEKELEEHCCVVMPSSGSTGPQKGVRHSEKSLMYSFFQESIINRKYTTITSLTGGYWVTGLMTRFLALFSGAINILLLFDCDTFLSSIEKYKIEFVVITVGYLGALMKFDWSSYDTSSLKEILYGGAQLPDDIADFIEKKHIPAYNGYGMTEMIMPFTSFAVRKKKRSPGKLISGVSAKIVSMETGDSLPANQRGELFLKGPNIMQCYHNNPTSTASLFDEEGWLQTGDLAYYDETGYFFIIDRIKELIKYQSLHINASEIEGLIYKLNGVIEVCVVGIPHPIDWEHTKAFVIRDPQSNITEEDIINTVKDQLPKYKWLHGGVQFVDKLPKTSTGKYLRREIRQLHKITAH